MSNEESIYWKNLGDENIKQNLYEEAIRCYENATRLDPGNTSAWNNMGYALSKLGRTDDAKRIKIKINALKEKEKIDSNITLSIQRESISDKPHLETNKAKPNINKESLFKQIQIQGGIQKISRTFTEKSLEALDSISGSFKSGTLKIGYNLLKRTHIVHIKKLSIIRDSNHHAGSRTRIASNYRGTEPPLLNTKSQKQVPIFDANKKGNCSVVQFPRTRVPQYSALRESA